MAGNNLFGANISGKIRNAFRGKLLKGTISKATAGSRTTTALAAGTNPSSTSSSFEGIFTTLEDRFIDETIVRRGDSAILIIGDSLSSTFIPAPGDTIVLEGRTVRLVNIVARDPDKAHYVVAVR